MPAVCLLSLSLPFSLSLSLLFIMLNLFWFMSLPLVVCPQLSGGKSEQLCSPGNSALFALLLHPANTLSACLAALGSLDCTQTTLEIGLINIQYARITHSLVACSASRWTLPIKWISLSPTLSPSLSPHHSPSLLSVCFSFYQLSCLLLVSFRSISYLYFVLHIQGICFISLTTVLPFLLSFFLPFFIFLLLDILERFGCIFCTVNFN